MLANGHSLRSLALHDPAAQLLPDRLQALLAGVEPGELPDSYGQGGVVARLEGRVAELLGKPAAVLMPTGAMASQVALRLHADARATRVVGFHPLAHVEVHERQGYALVHQLIGRHLGAADRLITLADLQAADLRVADLRVADLRVADLRVADLRVADLRVADLRVADLRVADLQVAVEPMAAVLWELPQRDLGGLLPEWADLVAQTAWVRERGAGTHLDGARLWEAQPYYDRSHAEIAELFDTVYVSLYKGLGGLAGGVLAGPEALIAEAREWRARLGGQLYQGWPVALAGELGLDRHLPQMAAYWARAREIALSVQGVEGIAVVPPVPQTPLFHVRLDAGREALEAAHQELVDEGGIRLFLSARASADPAQCQFEVTISERALALPVSEVRDALIALLHRAQRQP